MKEYIKENINELNKIISKIPYEIRDCLYIKIDKETALELLSSYNKISNNNITLTFPFLYKNIPIMEGKYFRPSLEIINDKEKIRKVFGFEYNLFITFKKKYEKLLKDHCLEITGCGCCGSPYAIFLTFCVNNIKMKNDKLNYDIEIKEEYKKILKWED